VTATSRTAFAEALAGERIRVDLGDRSYDIDVGHGLLAGAGARIRPLLAQPRVVVVTDERVANLYLEELTASLAAAGIVHAAVVLPPGEATKDFPHLADLCDQVLALGIERRTTLLALGGGVIGDITGFAAAILLRGLDFVQVPTTLLAQVDSSVGGKTGINTKAGKNLVGAFHQPKLVLADTATLTTLDDRQLRAGYAEVVKYGLLGDAPFFDWLEEYGDAVLRREPAALQRAVAVSCRAKAAVVAADEREGGIRALLNLGHTFGHALEAETGFGAVLLHGEAVAVGMVLAFELSSRLGLAAAEDAARVRRRWRHGHRLPPEGP
jgi:3-dehydroquinate synthase